MRKTKVKKLVSFETWMQIVHFETRYTNSATEDLTLWL